MQFLAKYISERDHYYLTIRADNLNEAMKIADRY